MELSRQHCIQNSAAEYQFEFKLTTYVLYDECNKFTRPNTLCNPSYLHFFYLHDFVKKAKIIKLEEIGSE